jgi:hypothetical protein
VAKDFYSFERVLKELQLEEEELKRLVSEGEIRAFRDQDTMKFKKEEVERFRSLAHGRKQDSMETMGEEDMPQELVFDEDDANQEVGMATAAIQDDSFLEEDKPLEVETRAPAPRARASSTTRGSKPRVVVDEPDSEEGTLWRAATIFITVLMFLGMFMALDAARSTPGAMSNGIMRWVGSTFNGIEYKE